MRSGQSSASNECRRSEGQSAGHAGKTRRDVALFQSETLDKKARADKQKVSENARDTGN